MIASYARGRALAKGLREYFQSNDFRQLAPAARDRQLRRAAHLVRLSQRSYGHYMNLLLREGTSVEALLARHAREPLNQKAEDLFASFNPAARPASVQHIGQREGHQVFVVHIDGRAVEVLVAPDVENAAQRAQQLAHAMAVLPPEVLSISNRVYVEEDAHRLGCVHPATERLVVTAAALEQPVLRAAATFAHELGHVLYYRNAAPGILGAFHRLTRGEAPAVYREAMREDGMAVSSYGNTNSREDFAEMFALWAVTQGDPSLRDVPRRLFPHRTRVVTAWMTSFLAGPPPGGAASRPRATSTPFF